MASKTCSVDEQVSGSKEREVLSLLTVTQNMAEPVL